MTDLRFEKRHMPAAKLGEESTLPSICEIFAQGGIMPSKLDEDDELFISYGNVPSIYPYRMQDNYSRELYDTEFTFAVLENEHLKASFLPAYGGKLWSLYDKDAGRELLFSNPVVRPCNLALRNAWTSGGVEWNCGQLGHHAHTCSPIHVAKTALEDGTPVLRMYEYERVRGCVYQMDFFLPAGSPVLLARMRIVNPHPTVVPMYWWSNIAVDEEPGSRVVMDTRETYSNRNNMVSKNSVPVFDGVDITYPVNNAHSVDFFWKIPKENRKFVCQLDREGYGLIQTSTSRQVGRKLFVWGQGPGGDRWQHFLTADDSNGRYIELQAGLAHTQYEHLPMPPKTAWEWLEAYGPLHADPAKIHGEWDGARDEVRTRLQELVGEQALEDLLVKTHAMAVSPAKEKISEGNTWGALENDRRRALGMEPICPHLDLGVTGPANEPWKTLLATGKLPAQDPDAAPNSWMLGGDWADRLRKLPEDWFAHLLLGTEAFSQRRFEEARKECEESLLLQDSVYGNVLLSQLLRIEGDAKDCAETLYRAASAHPTDLSLLKEAFKNMSNCGMDAEIVSLYGKLPEEMRQVSRLKMLFALATLRTGDIEGAEKLVYQFRTVVLADIREGETSVTELWYQVEEAKAKRDGRAFDRNEVTPPPELDFRMNAEKKKKA